MRILFPRETSPTGLAGALVLLGLLSSAYGVLILASIPRSDTATRTLFVFGLEFVVPGLTMAGVGVWLLGRARSSASLDFG